MGHFHRSFGSSRIDPKYSDLVIICDGYSYHVHRATVCSRSEVFARECNGAFKVSYCQQHVQCQVCGSDAKVQCRRNTRV